MTPALNFCSVCGHAIRLRVPPGDNRERAGCDACGTIHYVNPRMVVGTVPVWGEQVLLCRRAIEPRRNYWTLPAGFLEADETVAAGAIRETDEEAGARIVLGPLFTMLDVVHVEQVHLFYRAELLDIDFAPGEESLEVQLFDEADIPWDELAFRTVSTTLLHFFADRRRGHYELHTAALDSAPRTKSPSWRSQAPRPIHWLQPGAPFPPVEAALRDPPGLLAAGGDLSPARLVDAYRHGIFPWYSDGDPVLWWSTDPRMVLFVDEFRVSHSLRKRLARSIDDPAITIRCDTAFRQVIGACAQPREPDGGTWIVDEMIEAYVELHRLGVAHSVETWIDGELVGGLYGLAIGRMFYGESMFTRVPDASKIALAHLVAFARHQGIPMLDCQQQTAHLASMGARPIPRPDFSARIARLVDQQPVGAWPAELVWNCAGPVATKNRNNGNPA